MPSDNPDKYQQFKDLYTKICDETPIRHSTIASLFLAFDLPVNSLDELRANQMLSVAWCLFMNG